MDRLRSQLLVGTPSLVGVLADMALNVPAESWPATLRLVCADATDVNITHAIHAMGMYSRAVEPMSVRFAHHALVDAARRLRIVAVSA